MRLLIAALLVILAQVYNCGTAITGDPTAPDSGLIQRLKDAVSAGKTSSARAELLALPSDRRLEWLSELHQHGGTPNPSGGGSIADYTSLISLIESVIDAEWVSNGGSASLTPYRQGVRIDPQGLIERMDASKDILSSLKTLRDQGKTSVPAIVSLRDLGEWQQETSLRWISLHQLDQQVAERTRGDYSKRANISMELLGGLYRIDYLAYDKESREWFLGGPAGNLVANASHELLNPETGLPPVLLEDLLGIGPHVLQNKGEFGCTIDPDPKRLTAAHEMARASSSIRAMQRQPDRWSEQWRKTLGRQHAKVVGLRQDSPTGYALLVADAHMKRLGLGLEPCPTQMKSYWQEKDFFESANSTTDSSMVRWWFSLTDHKIPMDPDRKIYHFSSSNVQVMSEGQMMNVKGERVVASSPDLAADAFAKKFTLNFERLQREYPVYGRLRHIFDLAVALEIVRHEIQNGNGNPFVAIDQAYVQPKLPIAPNEVESIAATHRMPNGTTAVMISGGVAIHASSLRKRLKVDPTQINKVAFESSIDARNAIPIILQSESELKPIRDKPFWK